MRIAHLITGLETGGAETQLRLLLRHLPADCDVIVLEGREDAPGAVGEGIRADGGRVLALDMSGNRDLAALPRLVRLLRAGRYDVVHTHLYRACVYGRIAARLAGVRAVVATEHSLGTRLIEGRRLTPGIRALYLATERLGSVTVAVSDTVARRLRAWGVPGERLLTVPNGITTGHFRFDPAARRAVRERLGIPPGAFVAGAAGRLVPGKRFDTLVEAVATLPGAGLLIAGDGPEREALRARARALGVSGRVWLPGECAAALPPLGPAPRAGQERGPDGGPGPLSVPGVLFAMDAFVSPSAEETFGLACLEALAAGLPVRHVTCPAVDELPAGQVPAARRTGPSAPELAAELHALRAAGPVRHTVPPALRHYDIAHTTGRLLDLYRRLAARPAPRAVPAPIEASVPAPAPADAPASAPTPR